MKLIDKIECSESIQNQFEMSSLSATSYTFGVPGSQVTLNIGKSGERSLVLSREINPDTWSSQIRAYRASKSSEKSSAPVPAGQRRFPDGWIGPADTPFCKVCWDAGLPVADFNGHFVKDQPGPDGKVVCPTLLAQKCLDCGVAGHTSGYCSKRRYLEAERVKREREEREKVKKANGNWETVGAANSKPKARIEDMKQKSAAAAAAAAAPPRKTYGGSFGVLCPNDSSDESEYEREQEEIRNTPAGVPKPVEKERPILKGPSPAVEPPKPLSWAQRAAAAASKPTPSSAPAPTQSKLLGDTRFALHHALCENITVSKRAPPRGTSSESSKKRKQDSAIVPA